MIDLESETSLDPILRLHFLNRVHEYNDPFVLSVRNVKIVLVDGLVEQTILSERFRMAVDRMVSLPDARVLL